MRESGLFVFSANLRRTISLLAEVMTTQAVGTAPESMSGFENLFHMWQGLDIVSSGFQNNTHIKLIG